MPHATHAKGILTPIKPGCGWFGARYNMNLYRGCEHRCIYCDSRSACYGIEHFDDITVKVNALELLAQELPRKRVKGVISTGAMTDPYTWSERRYGLTGGALQLIARHGFGIHLTTKNDLVLRDLPVLQEISRVHASVCFTITTTDDAVARQVEPGAPPPSARFAALARLSEAGITTGVTLMPLLPFLEDTLENVRAIVERAAQCGVRYIAPWFVVSLRTGSRDYFYAQLDRHFPGLRQRYEAAYGDAYICNSPNADDLYRLFNECCRQHNITPRIPTQATPLPEPQLALF